MRRLARADTGAMVPLMPFRALRAAILGAAVALVAAAPAAAETIDVTPGTNKLGAAVAAADPGDELVLAPGGYAEAPVTVTDADITIRGAARGVVIAGTAAGDVIRFAAKGTLARATVLNLAGGGAAVAATDSLTLDEVIAVGGQGPGLAVTSPGAGGGDPVNAVSASDSIFGAPADRFAVTVTSGANSVVPPTQADDVQLTFDHVTIGGPDGMKGVSLDSSASQGSGCPLACAATGDIALTLRDSILDGASTTTERTGDGVASASNDAAITFAGANLADPLDGADGGPPDANAAELFRDHGGFDLRLRRTATAAIGAAEAGTGLDAYGDPRDADPDLGGDEYVNVAPAVTVRAATTESAPGEKVTYTADGRDADALAGDRLEYFWAFSDGRQAVTDVPRLDHTWATEGDKTVKVLVKDAVGGVSPIAELKVLVSPVKDTAAPEVEILQPERGQKLDLRGTKPKTPGKRRRPAQLVILGGVKDATGIKQVDVSLRLVKRGGRRVPGGGRCLFLKGAKGFRRTDCDRPVWLKASRTKNVWRLRTRQGWRVPRGTYVVRARGLDIVGNQGRATRPVRFVVAR